MSDLIGIYDAEITAVILICLFISFVRERRPAEINALVAMAALLILGILKLDDVLRTASNPALVTIGAMFVLSAALVRTGSIELLARSVTKHAATHPLYALTGFLCLVVVLSGFMNNTPLVMLMIPVTIAMAEAMNVSRSKLLIPLSFASILGGTTTLIGSSTNLLVDGVAQTHNIDPIGLFEITRVGIPVALVGILYLLLCRKWVPDRSSSADFSFRKKSVQTFLLEVVVRDGSPDVGKAPLHIPSFTQHGRNLVDVIRGDISLRRDFDSAVLQAGDIVVLRMNLAEALALQSEERSRYGSPITLPLGSRPSVVVECLIAPGNKLSGKTLRRLRLRRRYGIYPLALHHHGSFVSERFEQIPMNVGDTLLLEGNPDDLHRFAEDMGLVDLITPSVRPYRRRRAPIAIAIFSGVLVFTVFGVLALASLAIIGATLMLLFRCIEPDEAFQAIEWRLLTMLVAMLAVGSALEQTGLVQTITGSITQTLNIMSPMVMLILVYVLASIFTELLTNNTVAIVLTPIAISLADTVGADPRPFVIAVIFAASSSFLTPVGYQTNTLVYTAGGYRFTDFIRVGLGLNLLVGIITLWLIPIFWPL